MTYCGEWWDFNTMTEKEVFKILGKRKRKAVLYRFETYQGYITYIRRMWEQGTPPLHYSSFRLNPGFVLKGETTIVDMRDEQYSEFLENLKQNLPE